MSTLKDVAKLANVDVSTVSRALNNTSYVHPETKERIYAAVKKLSYHPNVLAQGLRKGKMHTIGLVIPRFHITIFAQIAQSIEEEARKHGYAILVCYTDDDPKIERDALNRLRSAFVDGIIIAGTGKNTRLVRDIKAEGIAIVQIIRLQDEKISSVVSDYYNIALEAVNYLYKKGCRKIGFINDSMELNPFRERYNGYKKAITEFNLEEISVLSKERTDSFEYGYECTLDLIERCPDIDAIMAAMDVQGLGVIRALKVKAITVPDQVKVISLTGHFVGSMLEKSMTSMEIPAKSIGEKATQMILEAINAENESALSCQHLRLSFVLVEREST